LTGEGPVLRVYDHATGRFLVETQIFFSQCIHGIAVYDSTSQQRGEERILLVWGGRSFRVVRIVCAEGLTAGHDALRISLAGAETCCSDWILDVAFQPDDLQSDDGLSLLPSAVLITAHNELLILRVQCDQTFPTKHQVLVKPLVSGPRSVLYSAHVLWLTPTHVVVAAGTVFGDVLLWSCRSNCTLWDSACSTVHLHHKFTGHEGSIHGVHISPEILDSSLGYPGRLLASCSDDRQIRIWQVSDLDAQIVAGQAIPEKEPFGAREDEVTTIQECLQPGKCIASVWAHASRIWSVRFLPPLQESQNPRRFIHLISMGEDATAQRWDFSLQKQSPGAVQRLDDTTAQLKHVSTWDFHSGKNLWSSGVIAYSPSSWLLVTGGADGKIISYKISQKETAAIRGFVSMNTVIGVGDVGERCRDGISISDSSLDPSLQHKDVSQYEKLCGSRLPLQHHPTQSQAVEAKTPNLESYSVKRFTFVDKDSLLAITTAGQVIVGSLYDAYSAHSGCMSQIAPAETPICVNWDMIRQSDSLGSYSMLAGVPTYRMAFLSGTDGMIYGYNHETRAVNPFVPVHRKVSGLYAQVISQAALIKSKEGQIVGLVAAVLGSLTAQSWSVQREDAHDSRGTIKVLRSWVLNLPPAFPITSAYFLFSANMLLLGSRNGSLTVYRLSGADKTPDDKKTDGLYPQACFSRLHGDDTITNVMAVPQSLSHGEGTNVHILTAGRDGTYSIHCLYYQQDADNNDEVRLSTVHTSSPPFGRNIESACFDAVSRDLILCGFRGKQFLVWNECKQLEIMSIECGGAHREWCYLYDHHGGGSLVWMKASKLKLYRQLEPSYHVIKEGGHGREIKALAIFTPRNVTHYGPTSLIVTGAEDTSLRLFVRRNDPTSRNNPELRCSGVFRKHTTGIQHLQWCGHTGFLFSSGSFEEFLVWRVKSVPVFGVGMVCEAECPTLGAPLDLRVMSFHVLDMVNKSPAIDQQACFLICVIYSDSTIRVSCQCLADW